jgi:hypothetical protein
MRRARLTAPAAGDRERIIRDVGCGVAGPLLFGFAVWCLREANARGIRRLYFVSRDGQILQRVACEIAASWGLPLECRYLYGSRQAWHAASIEKIDRTALDWVLAPTRGLSVRQVLVRVGLQPESCRDELDRGGFPESTWDEPLSGDARSMLGELLLREPFSSASERSASSRRERALRYLRQEGLLDEAPKAIVDVGWHGNLQRSLAGLLRAGGYVHASRLTGLYFGLLPGRPSMEGQTSLGYWNALPAYAYELQLHNTAMFEIFTAADHGSVMGYEEADGRMVPLLEHPTNRNGLAWGLRIYQDSVMAFAHAAVKHLKAEDWPPTQWRSVARLLYRAFYYRPSAEEAAVWGSYPFSDQQVESTYEVPVPPWTRRELLAALLDYRLRPSCWWPEGMLAVGGSLPLDLFVRVKKLRWLLKHKLAGSRDRPGS